MSKPLFEKLNSFSSSGVLSMHMPGHKRNAEKFPWLKSLDLTRDITEISGFDNLNDPETVFAELNARLARRVQALPAERRKDAHFKRFA